MSYLDCIRDLFNMFDNYLINKIKEANRAADSIEADDNLNNKDGSYVYNNSGYYLMGMINPFHEYKDKYDVINELRRVFPLDTILTVKESNKLPSCECGAKVLFNQHYHDVMNIEIIDTDNATCTDCGKNYLIDYSEIRRAVNDSSCL